MNDLLTVLTAHDRLMNWWADVLANCAARKVRRLNTKRPAALKGKETERARVRANDPLLREALHG